MCKLTKGQKELCHREPHLVGHEAIEGLQQPDQIRLGRQ